jgi:hypothetical protein
MKTFLKSSSAKMEIISFKEKIKIYFINVSRIISAIRLGMFDECLILSNERTKVRI